MVSRLALCGLILSTFACKYSVTPPTSGGGWDAPGEIDGEVDAETIPGTIDELDAADENDAGITPLPETDAPVSEPDAAVVVDTAPPPPDYGPDLGPPQPENEILILDTKYMRDLKGNAAGVIDEKTFWPFFDIPDNVPADWTRPIAYDRGTAYAYLDVQSKPTTARTMMMWLMWQDGNNQETAGARFDFTDPGVYTSVRYVELFAKIVGTFDFSRVDHAKSGIATKTMVLGKKACPIHPSSMFEACGGWAARDMYHPIHYRMIVVVVPPGVGFSGWDRYVNR